jgi:hypothetical protein
MLGNSPRLINNKLQKYEILNTDKNTEIFCLANEFCKEFGLSIKENRSLFIEDEKTRNRSHQMSDNEIITILMLYHFGSFKNFKHFLPDVYWSYLP